MSRKTTISASSKKEVITEKTIVVSKIIVKKQAPVERDVKKDPAKGLVKPAIMKSESKPTKTSKLVKNVDNKEEKCKKPIKYNSPNSVKSIPVKVKTPTKDAKVMVPPTVVKPVKKRPGVPVELRNDVWEKYHGINKIGKCYCCNKEIGRYDGWHCAHVIAHDKGGPDAIGNLRTSCGRCNLSMGNQNLYAYIRDKNLKGMGYTNVKSYFKIHPDHINDKRTNNWGKKT